MKAKWVALIAALALPALAWAATGKSLQGMVSGGKNCPIPCGDCPLSKR